MQGQEWIQPRSGLGRLADKLNRQPCRIAYLGASVTVQKEGYRPRLQAWFGDHFGQSHIPVNAAIGGVGCVAGAFLMDELVIKHKPDLCLIEFSTGDVGQDTPLGLIGPAVEGIVRKLQAIDCQICILHLYRRDGETRPADRIVAEYEQVADWYGIPSIHVDQAIEARLKTKGWHETQLFRDMVHTTPEGSEHVAQLIADGLCKICDAPAPSCAKPAAPCFSRPFDETEIVPPIPEFLSARTRYSSGRFRFFYPYLTVEAPGTVSFQSEADIIGMVVVVGPASGIIDIKTPDERIEHRLWDPWCHYERLNVVLFSRRKSPLRTVDIQVTDKPVDYSGSRKPIRPALSHSLKLIGFMVKA